jgi:putative ABC transport system permease protein
MSMVYNASNGAMSIRVKSTNIDETIAYVGETWKKVNPGTTFDYAFLDEQFATLYSNEEAFRAMFSHFTLLALLIAGLGLFALSAYSTEQRKKEIGIRKVLGASTLSILFRLSVEYVVLIAISFGLASVVAYFVMDKWLEEFQYSIRISAGIFIVAGSGAVIIALLTISFQAIKAALHNPVKSLRSE